MAQSIENDSGERRYENPEILQFGQELIAQAWEVVKEQTDGPIKPSAKDLEVAEGGFIYRVSTIPFANDFININLLVFDKGKYAPEDQNFKSFAYTFKERAGKSSHPAGFSIIVYENGQFLINSVDDRLEKVSIRSWEAESLDQLCDRLNNPFTKGVLTKLGLNEDFNFDKSIIESSPDLE